MRCRRLRTSPLLKRQKIVTRSSRKKVQNDYCCGYSFSPIVARKLAVHNAALGFINDGFIGLLGKPIMLRGLPRGKDLHYPTIYQEFR